MNFLPGDIVMPLRAMNCLFSDASVRSWTHEVYEDDVIFVVIDGREVRNESRGWLQLMAPDGNVGWVVHEYEGVRYFQHLKAQCPNDS